MQSATISFKILALCLIASPSLSTISLLADLSIPYLSNIFSNCKPIFHSLLTYLALTLRSPKHGFQIIGTPSDMLSSVEFQVSNRNASKTLPQRHVLRLFFLGCPIYNTTVFFNSFYKTLRQLLVPFQIVNWPRPNNSQEWLLAIGHFNWLVVDYRCYTPQAYI